MIYDWSPQLHTQLKQLWNFNKNLYTFPTDFSLMVWEACYVLEIPYINTFNATKVVSFDY